MRFLRWLFVFASLGAIASSPGCSCNSNIGAGDGFRPGGDGFVQIGSLELDPGDVTLDLTMGMAPPSQTYKVTYHGPSSDKDITSDPTVMFTLADPTLGTMNTVPNVSAPTFVAGTAHGGTTTLVATWMSKDTGLATGQATIHVRVHGGFSDTSCMTGCNFPPDGAPPCATGAEATVIYPPDGVLLPPNLNSLEVQFTPGTGDTMFEIDFENPATDVRIVTKCNPTVDTRGQMSNGCKVDLTSPPMAPPTMWDFMATSNKGGDPITVTIRATTDGKCASPSKNSVKMSVAEQDIQGGIYYWKSTVTPTGTGGDIWRKDFGNPKPEEVIGQGINGFTCLGCHALSRDGTRMTLNGDDADSDDEYNDVRMGLVDVSKKAFITTVDRNNGAVPGFSTFSADGKYYLSSDGDGSMQSLIQGGGANAPSSNIFWLWNAKNGMSANPAYVSVGMMNDRPTMPDWSGDNKNVVFVMPQAVGWNDGNQRLDDAHVYGGSLWTMPVTGAGSFGPASPLVMSSGGDNNYYPSYSPDGAFIVYNHVPSQPGGLTNCTIGSCPNDSFSNPKARVSLLPTGGGVVSPIDLEAANGSPKTAPVDVSNSWPRWTPFVQTYKGAKLLWITFSSTRDYGLRVRNHVQVGGQSQVQCYPPDSAEEPGQPHGTQFPGNCQQPQIWMAAINLTSAEVSAPGDPSYPSFWLPFQDINTHNHSAQWTQQVVTMPPPPPDGGACIAGGGNCTQDPNGCCTGLVCTGNGTCGIL